MPSVAVLIVDAADADKQRWDEYVLRNPAATFFHRFGWRNVLSQAFGHRAHYLIAEREGRVVGVLPLGEIKSLLFGHSLISTPFCVVGGAVADDDQARDALIDAACQRAARARRLVSRAAPQLAAASGLALQGLAVRHVPQGYFRQ